MNDYGKVRQTIREMNAQYSSLDGATCLRFGCSGTIQYGDGGLVCGQCGHRYQNG